MSVKDERDILIVEDDATTRSASLLYDEAFCIFVIITIDFPQQHLFQEGADDMDTIFFAFTVLSLVLLGIGL